MSIQGDLNVSRQAKYPKYFRILSVAVGDRCSMASKTEGALWRNSLRPVKLELLTKSDRCRA